MLVGDSKFTLTNTLIQASSAVADAEGKVPTWFGICHGWAPASFMMPRPELGVTATTAEGKEIFFTPTDLKALASLLWANGEAPTRFVGSRCNDTTPDRDPNFRETNPDCFDTNPATWHLAVVNQIGVSHRSFVLDASAGAEVWNQPVYGYQYGYINPITNKSYRTLADAKVKLKDWSNDPYSKTRSPKAVNVVRIVMSLDYLAENSPTVSIEDGTDQDAHYNQNYSYDLELDQNDTIVGGEWHNTLHPDFLWAPEKNSKATSVGDTWLERSNDQSKWSGREPLPALWKKAANLSSKNSQPLAKVVERLFQMVHEGR